MDAFLFGMFVVGVYRLAWRLLRGSARLVWRSAKLTYRGGKWIAWRLQARQEMQGGVGHPATPSKSARKEKAP